MIVHIDVTYKDAAYHGGVLAARDAALADLGPLARLTERSKWGGDWSDWHDAWRFEVDVPSSPEGLLL